MGAFTEKTRITDPALKGFTAIAPSGGLSPFSTTSTTWARKWPLKPDVVFEGGNVAKGPNNSVLDADDLQLVSTYHDPQTAQFAPFCATSAAAAQAAWMAATIRSRYPEMWPETVRALIVHTADWTSTMRNQFLPAPPIEPTKDMHFYSLPWPWEVLRDLGETPINMRITLSYFVEPGPGEIGWQDRYRYASHALRFAVNGPGESEKEFKGRINNQARDDGYMDAHK